ncbi:hypothetical protein ACHAWT_002389 [Skeletonema menzelii]
MNSSGSLLTSQCWRHVLTRGLRYEGRVSAASSRSLRLSGRNTWFSYRNAFLCYLNCWRTVMKRLQEWQKNVFVKVRSCWVRAWKIV